MAMFGASSQSYLGIDIGSSSLKIVELKNEKGRPKLVTYGYIDQGMSVLRSKEEGDLKKIAEAIKTLNSKARTTSKKVIAALPSYTVFSSVLSLPEMPKKEFEQVVNLEAKKFIPMPLEEMVLDWKILEGLEEYGKFSTGQEGGEIKTKEKKQVKVLITAAPKDLVNKYVQIFKMAGLELVSLETESFAIERSLVGQDKSPILLIDIGSQATNIAVTMASVPLISRSIDVGGRNITNSVAQSMGVELGRAEQFKRDLGSSDQFLQMAQPMLDAIVNEVRYVIELYQNQSSQPLEKVILAGGSAWLSSLSDHLSKELGMKVFLGDPWGRVIYPVELKPVLKEIGPAMAVAIGLAMREIV